MTVHLYREKCTEQVYDSMESRKSELKSWVQPYHKLSKMHTYIKKTNKKDEKGRK